VLTTRLAGLAALTLFLFAFGGASTPVAASFAGSQNVTVPTSGTQTFTWSGNIPAPSSHPASSCPNHLDPTADYEDIVLTVPANLYSGNTATFTFAITWATASTTTDEVLSLLDSSDNVLQSSDGSTNTEQVTVSNLAAGTYHVVACGFINQSATAYSGSLSITTAPTPPPPTPYPAANLSFGVPTVMDPDIGVSAAGNVFASGPAGTGTQRSFWEGSVDGGQTFRLICPAPNPLPSAVQGCNSPPGGGDTDIAFDHQTPQGQYFSDLYALAGFRVAATHNEASTQPAQGVEGSAGATPEVDRQWFAVFDPPTGVTPTSAYTGARPLIYNEFGPAPSVWTKSNDGITFTRADHSVKHFGADGYPAIDQVTGKVFEAVYNGNTIQLNIGTPQATGDLCFLDSTIAEAGCPTGTGVITVASGVVNSGDTANFVVSSMDSARNLYVVWVGRSGTPAQRQVFVSAASAASNWTTWYGPVQVSDGSAQTGDAVNVFPWIKAGGRGLADAVWYGDASGQDPSAANSGHVWNVFMSPLQFPTDTSGSVNGTPAGSLSIAKVTPHPMDYLDICLGGTGCITSKGNRNLADFFMIKMGNDGAAEIVYNDMSNGLIQTGPNAPATPADHPGAAVVTVARQNSGNGLLGAPVAGAASTPVSGLADVPNDALYPVMGGANQPALDLLASGLSLSGTTLTVTMKVADLGASALTSAASATQGTDYQYVTRWQMGNTLYYAEMYGTPASLAASLTSAQFSAGKTQSIDLCSVSACDPHVLTYPEANPPDTMPEVAGSSVTCPTNPGINNPCSITISVNTAHVGNPTNSSLLEEVGAYSFASARPQSVSTNAQAQVDQVPLEVDGVCCYNFQGSPVVVPEFPTPVVALFGAIGVLSGMFAWRRLRRRQELVG
jgi:hypothetical protein